MTPNLIESSREAASKEPSLEESTQGSQDEIFPDSGYASKFASCRSSTLSNPVERPPVFVLESGFLRRKSRTLHEYNKEIPPSTWNRFCALHELHGQCLLDYLSTQRAFDTLTKRRRNYGSRSVSTKLKVLGETEATAKPWVVVRCDQTDYRGVRNFFNQKHVIADYEGPHVDADLPSLEVIIHLRAPVQSAANENSGIYASWPIKDDLKTLCGQVIKVSNSSQVKFATLGGIIKIAAPENEFMLYGLTVGHVFQIDSFSESGSHSEMEGEEDNGGVEIFSIDESFELDTDSLPDSDPDLEIATEIVHHSRRVEFSKVCSRIGHVVMTSTDLFGRRGNLDWGLVEIDDSSVFRPNFVHGCDNGQQDQVEIGLSEFYLSPLPEEDRPVILLGGMNGNREGLLSTHPSFINLPDSDTFIETFNLSLSKGNKIQRGDCGSWVVDRMTHQVYGHIVASDSNNEAYVVPLRAIFEQIKNCAGTNYVRLAKENDIHEWRRRHADGKAPVEKAVYKCQQAGDFQCDGNVSLKGYSSKPQRSISPTGTSIRRKRGGGTFFKQESMRSPTLITDDRFSSHQLSPDPVPSMLLNTPASSSQHSKLYTPPCLRSISLNETQQSHLKIDRHNLSRGLSQPARVRYPGNSDANISSSPVGSYCQTTGRMSLPPHLPKQDEMLSRSPISPIEDLSSTRSDQLHEAALIEYQRQYGILEPWTEFLAEPKQKSNEWDSGYSTAESANHSPAP